MTIDKSLAWKKLLWQWLVACVVAKLLQIIVDGVAGVVASATGGGFTGGSTSLLLILIVFRLIGGALGGTAQWLVLRQWLPSIRSWVLATSLGSAIALAVINGLWAVTLMPPASGLIGGMMPTMSVLPQFLFDGIYGILLGVAQWLVLRTKVPQAGWWVLISGVGAIASSIGIDVLQRFVGPMGIDVSQSAWNPFFWAIASVSVVLYAAISGGFLVWSLRQRF
ncbi:hypothetical protein NDI44_03150 [Trichocoleus sp. DQ-A3]|uniref:hypothetical protein n=1 Tax=Cyanophyceae TaxID=3028117 RepID=UPI001685D4E3|nr:hypothetical protein [Coleofasciculus sp. FACHB-125]MBD1900716.1 hypothetical protein [Coleofasciculus sp. FACHB-125]